MIDSTGLLSTEAFERLQMLYGDTIDPRIIQAEEIREKYNTAMETFDPVWLSPNDMKIFFEGMSIRMRYDINRLHELEKSVLEGYEAELYKLTQEREKWLHEIGAYDSFGEIVEKSTKKVFDNVMGWDYIIWEYGVDKAVEKLIDSKVPLSNIMTARDAVELVGEELLWAQSVLRKNTDFKYAMKHIVEMYRIKEKQFSEMKRIIPLLEELSTDDYSAKKYQEWYTMYTTSYCIKPPVCQEHSRVNAYMFKGAFEALTSGDIWNEEGTKIVKRKEDLVRKLLTLER